MKFPTTPDPLSYFATLVTQEASGFLFEAALAIAQDAQPAIDLVATQDEFDLLLNRLRHQLPENASETRKLRILIKYFYKELGFGANLNNYYDPDNSYLHRVLATRRGIPISIAVVFMEFAHQIGVPLHGVSFPGHFLLKLQQTENDVVFDPLTGESLSREHLALILRPHLLQMAKHNADNSGEANPRKELAADADWEIDDFQLQFFLQSASPTQILVRMLQNLKMIFVRNHDWQRMLPVLQRLVILQPEDFIAKRDRGYAYANLECPQAALQDLEAYLQAYPQASDAAMLNQLLQQLRQAASRFN